MARPSVAVGKLFVAGDAGGGATIFRLVATRFLTILNPLDYLPAKGLSIAF
jgi:hypothetical protein